MFSTLFRVLFLCIIFFFFFFQLNAETTLLHKTFPDHRDPPLNSPPTMTHPANPAPTSNQTCTHRKTTKNLQPTHCKNSEIYTKPTTSHPKNQRPTASHRTQKPTTIRTPPHQTHQHKTQQTNKTTKKIHKKYNLLGRWGSRSRRGEREAVRRVGAQVGL